MEKSQTGTVTGGSKLEKLWREAHDNTGSKANCKSHRAETADL